MISRVVGRRARSAAEVFANQLDDPAVRADWVRLTPARAVALPLVAYRAEHGLTQTVLVRILGMPQPAVARLESGEYVPSPKTLIRLAEIRPRPMTHWPSCTRVDSYDVMIRSSI